MQQQQPEAANPRQAAWCRPLSSCTPAGLPPPPTDGAAATGPSGALAALLPPVVALGKFDALHRGHRALAEAAAELGGAPWLVSFSGIAEVLGWPARLPLVAPCDRRRVLASWAPHCLGRPPGECAIPFAEVRSMSPEAFVELLAAELRVAGVVVGANYRFGYRAAGTAQLLEELGPQHGMRIRVLSLVHGAAASGSAEAEARAAEAAEAATAAAAAARERQQAGGSSSSSHQQQGGHGPEQRAADRREAHEAVSSSRVRRALSAGDVADAAQCLGRPYRLVCLLGEDAATSALADGAALRLPAASLLNQPPRPGRYAVEAALTGAETLQQLAAPRRALLAVDEAGATLHACGDMLAALPSGAQHLALDFLDDAAPSDAPS